MYHKHYDFSQVDALKEKIIGDTNAHYIGRILTIVDASVTGEQGKAMKDLVKKEMYEYLQDSFEDARRLISHTVRAVEDVWVKGTLEETDDELKSMDVRIEIANDMVKTYTDLQRKAAKEEVTLSELLDNPGKYNLSDKEKKMIEQYKSRSAN